jgi:hypothetical protein
MPQVWLTAKIKRKLDETAKLKSVTEEGLANVLLALSLCDEEKVTQAVNLINMWELGGMTRLEKITL